MELYVLDKEFSTVAVLDIYESFIWTDRYDECGDFEACFSPHDKIMEFMISGNYVWRKDSEHVMIIQNIEITTDVTNGSTVIVTGESLESILKNRVIDQQTILSGSFQNGIRTLLNQTIISPSLNDRRIENFIFKESFDPEITKLVLDAQYFGENLYDVIAEVCYDNHIGFKVTLDDSNQFVFELYAGTDRSYDQNERPYVIFSPYYDNFLNSNYMYNAENIRNVAYIAGEEPDISGEEKPLITSRIVAMTGSGSGLERKEIFVDGSNLKISYKDEANKTIYLTEEEYRSQLEEKGKEQLAEYYAEETFDGEVQGDYQWLIGRDYFMGDIVQLENEYGRSTKCRVVEMITSEDTSGISFYPSFENVKDSSSLGLID